MIPKEKFVESFYNFKLSLDNDALLMYNTKRGTVVLLESRQAKEFENYLENPKYDSNSSLISELKKLGFLIEPDANELNEIRAWHDKFRKDKRLLHITMLPSESCNFACPYCFQYQKRNKFMKDWVYEAVLNFIKNITLENQAIGEETYVKINWFGGEPLLQANKIINFHEKLKILSENLNLKYDAVVVTNGYLLNPHLMKTFVNLGIKDFQVTLDGNKDTHDSLRRLKNGRWNF